MSIDITGSNHNAPETRTFDGETYTVYPMVYVPVDSDEEDASYFASRLNLNNANGRAFIAFLGFDPGEGPDGSVTVAEMRRAIMVARATFERRVSDYTRETAVTYGAPRVNDDGTVELRPARFIDCGIDQDYLARRLEQLATLVENLAANGATHITWG